MTFHKEALELAIYAAFGHIDTRDVTRWPQTAARIAEFVASELDGRGLCIAVKGARGPKFNPIGRRFNRLLVTKELPRYVNSKGTPIRTWECVCDCGNKTRVFASQICGKRVTVNSCGCYHREQTGNRNRTHGFAGRVGRPPEYHVWQSMKRRCSNPNDAEYHNYGGRGISVCARWKSSFVAFYEDMGSRTTPDHSLDRIDVNGNYEPGNCRWATWKEQRANQRRAA